MVKAFLNGFVKPIKFFNITCAPRPCFYEKKFCDKYIESDLNFSVMRT